VSLREKMTLNEDLIEAASRGDLEKVKELLDRGADVNARDNNGKTPLDLARAMMRRDIVNFLEKKL
jgi:ankyrin repeat protein